MMMHRYLKYISLAGRILLVLAVLTSMVAVASSDLVAMTVEEEHCDEECQNECDESCDTCGDCVHCLPTVHLISSLGVVSIPAANNPTGTVDLPNFDNERGEPRGIDHPPQNFA